MVVIGLNGSKMTAYYLSLMLHKLACIIILKRANFSGYILNNPVLFNCEKAVMAGENALIMI